MIGFKLASQYITKDLANHESNFPVHPTFDNGPYHSYYANSVRPGHLHVSERLTGSARKNTYSIVVEAERSKATAGCSPTKTTTMAWNHHSRAIHITFKPVVIHERRKIVISMRKGEG